MRNEQICDHHLLLPTGVPSWINDVISIYTSFASWLAALCRPQERGRQCAAIVQLKFNVINSFILTPISFASGTGTPLLIILYIVVKVTPLSK